MKKFLRILWIIVVLAWAFLVIWKTTNRFTPTQPSTALANPASIYCQQQSGTLEIVTDASGAQSGICHLVDGTACDEWAYFRGECLTTWTSVNQSPRCTKLEDCGVDYRCKWTDNTHTQCVDVYENTCSALSNTSTSETKEYTNTKYSYTLQYPSDVTCEGEEGIGMDPQDTFCCSLGGSTSYSEWAFVCLEAQKINTVKKEVSFHDNIKMGSYTTLSLQNKDALTSIKEEMSKLKYSWPIENILPTLDQYNIIGFTKTEQHTSSDVNWVKTPFTTYLESHFFVNNNTLYSLFVYYDVPEECNAVQSDKITKLRNIFNTLTFTK